MPEPTEFSGRPSAPGPRSALLVGLAVVAFIALAVAQPWSPPPPQPTASPAALASAAATATATTSPATPLSSGAPAPSVPMTPFTLVPPLPGSAPWASIRWQAIDPASALAHLGTAVRWAGGYASLGGDGRGGSRLWTTRDASVWRPVGSGTATTFWPGVHVESVAPLGRQLLAVTSLPAALSSGSVPSPDPASADPSAPQPVVLASWLSDDGAAWQMRGGPIFPQPTRLSGPVVAAGSGGRAVIGWNEWPEPGGHATGHLALTTDGANWAQVPASALPSGFEVMDVVAAPGGGFLAAGKSITNGLASVALLRSDATASVWTPVALPQELLTVGERANVVWRLAVGATGVIAMGDSPARELWWWSADGRHWTPVADFAPVGASGCPGSTQGCGAYADGMVAGDGERVVAVGGAGDPTTVVAWAAPDGRTWQRLGAPGVVPRDRAGGIVLLPGGIVLLGSTGAWYGEAASLP